MVEFVSIGSLLTRKRVKAKKLGAKAPVFAVTNNKGFALSADLHDFTIHSEDTANYLVVEKNDFAYNPSRLNVGSIAYFKNEGKGLISPMYVVFHADETRVLPEYLYVVIKSEAIKNKIDSLKEEGARFRFDFKRWDLIQIPIPSLSEQTRIVEILDTFSASIENLKQQIAERRKQYEYYRNNLFEFKEGECEWKKIREVGTVTRGTSFQKKHFTDEGTPCIHYGQIYTQYAHHVYETISFVGDEISRSPRRAKTGALVMATTSENIDDVGKCIVWLGEEDVIVSNDACFIQHTLNPKYFGYLLQTESFSTYKKKVATGTKVIRINTDAVADFIIPIPSLQEQSRIASILDTFEAAIANLEAQLKEREKQYEYYRNKLLTFE